MALEERARLEMRRAVVELLGPEHGNRLMDQVPPFDWADVAMKQDLVALEARLDERFDNIDRRFQNINERFDNLDRRFDNINERFDNLDRRFDNINERFQNIDRRFEAIEPQFPALHAQFATVNYQLEKLLARPENNRALYFAVIGVIFTVATLTFAAAQFTR